MYYCECVYYITEQNNVSLTKLILARKFKLILEPALEMALTQSASQDLLPVKKPPIPQ